MKKLKSALLILLSLFTLQISALPLSAYGAFAGDPAKDPLGGACTSPGASASEVCKNYRADAKRDNILGPNGIVTRVIQTLIFVVAAITLVAVIIGGLRYALSGGDPNGVKQAKDTILYALIGMVLALFAQVIVSFVLSKV